LALADHAGRTARYRSLVRRNRVVTVLRLAVPAIGALTLAVLLVQIAVSSFGARFNIGRIEVSPERITVETPEYAGTMSDGSTYRVWAEEAAAAVSNTDLLALENARVVLERVSGLRQEASAAIGMLDTAAQQVRVEGATDIDDSGGTTGRIYDSVFDWATQILTARGAVSIDYADGATVRAKGMVHEAELGRWTFTNATVTLPATPGEQQQ
jgi:lipopolysaccharide export system protein LptC